MFGIVTYKDLVGMIGGTVGLVSGAYTFWSKWSADRTTAAMKLSAAAEQKGSSRILLTISYAPAETHEGFTGTVRLIRPEGASLRGSEEQFEVFADERLAFTSTNLVPAGTASPVMSATLKAGHAIPPIFSTSFFVEGPEPFSEVVVKVVVTSKASRKRLARRTMAISTNS